MSTNPPAEIVIPLSRGKIAVMFLGSIAFVVVCIWLWFVADTQPRYDSLYMKAAAIAGVLFFGACGAFACFKFFDTEAGLIVDDQGIVDNSSAAAFGRILWDEIIEIRVSVISRQRMITILVTDPEKFLARSSFIAKPLHKANMAMTGSPINIVSNGLAITHDDLLQTLTEAFERHSETDR